MASAAPVPSPEAERKVQDRPQVEVLERHTSARLRRLVRCEQVPKNIGVDAAGYERGSVRDEAVQNDRDAESCRFERAADHGRYFEPTYLRQCLERIGTAGEVKRERVLDHADLCARASSLTPVPRPTTVAGGLPVKTLVSAAAAVVLPIPISPSPMASAPAAILARQLCTNLDRRAYLVRPTWRPHA